jgi:hypothetical protein
VIAEQDLQAAIAECLGKRNPDAKTCIMLAAFITIKNHLYPDKGQGEDLRMPPMSQEPVLRNTVSVESQDTDFVQAVNGRNVNDVLDVINDAMGVLYIRNRPLYNAILRNLEEL